MRETKIRYIYPQKKKIGYKPKKAFFVVSDDNIEKIVGEPNPIDCICDAMKLVIMERYDGKVFHEEISSFFGEIDSYDDFVNKTIIELFAQEDRRHFMPKTITKEILFRSSNLVNRFRDIYGRFIKE